MSFQLIERDRWENLKFIAASRDDAAAIAFDVDKQLRLASPTASGAASYWTALCDRPACCILDWRPLSSTHSLTQHSRLYRVTAQLTPAATWICTASWCCCWCCHALCDWLYLQPRQPYHYRHKEHDIWETMLRYISLLRVDSRRRLVADHLYDLYRLLKVTCTLQIIDTLYRLQRRNDILL